MNDSFLTCPNCKTENPYFNLNCKNCNYYLRDKVPNLNLGETLLQLIESPKTAFEKIIFADKKNFILIILNFISIRFLILARFISVPFSDINVEYNLFVAIIYFFFTTLLAIAFLSVFTNYLLKKIKIISRFKDIFAVINYSLVPQVLSLILLYPIELVVYGRYLFSNNPYPYEIKENVFYIFLVVEILSIIWSLLLMIKGIIALRAKTFLAFIITLFNYFVITAFLYLSAKIIFEI